MQKKNCPPEIAQGLTQLGKEQASHKFWPLGMRKTNLRNLRMINTGLSHPFMNDKKL